MKMLLTGWKEDSEGADPIIAEIDFTASVMEKLEHLHSIIVGNNLHDASFADTELKATFYTRSGAAYPTIIRMVEDGLIEWVNDDLGNIRLTAAEELDLLRRHFEQEQTSWSQGVYLNCEEYIECMQDEHEDWTVTLPEHIRSLVRADDLARRASSEAPDKVMQGAPLVRRTRAL